MVIISIISSLLFINIIVVVIKREVKCDAPVLEVAGSFPKHELFSDGDCTPTPGNINSNLCLSIFSQTGQPRVLISK